MYFSEHIITSKHYLILSVSAFAIGIFIAAVLGYVPSTVLLLMVFLLCLVLSVALIVLKKSPRKALLLTLLMCVFAFLGVLRLYIADAPGKHTLSGLAGKEAWLSGSVASEPRLTQNKYSYTFELDVFSVNNNIPAQGKIVMYTPAYNDCNFKLGDNVFCWTKIELPESSENPINFDHYTQSKSRNIFLSGNTKNVNLSDKPFPLTPVAALKKVGYIIRTKISSAVDSLFKDDVVASAILKGILIGDKSDFTDTLYEKFSNAGISHIVAVSGLHLSILYAVVIFLLSAVTKRRKLKFVAAIPFILLFMSASAFTHSVCRASIMLITMIFAVILRREYNPVTALFLSFGILIFIAPYSVFSKSLVSSCLATLGIFVYFPYINEFSNSIIGCIPNQKIYKPLKWVSSMFLSSVGLSIATFIPTSYFLALFFGKISYVQVLTNLWVIPLASVIFGLGYLASIMFYICPWVSVNILYYPLKLCVDTLKYTIIKFGDARFALKFVSTEFHFTHFIVFLGIAFIIYMTLKAFHDIKFSGKS